MRAYESIAVCYSSCNYHNVAISYYKKALQLAYDRKDTMIELHYYDKLSRAYMNAGNPTKMVAYHKRVFYGLLEPEDSFVRQAS